MKPTASVPNPTHRYTVLFLLFALILSVPLYFENAVQYSVPMGYAGLFTQMADQIAGSNFHLPLQSPYYGPGGIPFAYPPLGLYLLAIFIKLTGKYFIFLRLLPPLLSLLSLIPLFFLMQEMSGSSAAAAFTVILAATSMDLYVAHAWASGIVRAPAFLFALLAIYCFTRNRSSPARKYVVGTGIFLGLTILTHLEYALFSFVWVAYWTLLDRSMLRRIKESLIACAVGLGIGLLWAIPTAIRFGPGVLLNAFNSHGNGEFLSVLLNPRGAIPLFLTNSAPLTDDILVGAVLLLCVLLLLFKKQFALPFFLVIIILAFPDNARFVFLAGSLVFGLGLAYASEELSGILPYSFKPSTTLITLIVGSLILVPVWITGFNRIAGLQPDLYSSTLDLEQKVKADVPEPATYLALVKQDEAEWLPFLMQRQPLVAQWGSEWLGTYNQQTAWMSQLHDCQSQQDWSCIQSVIAQIGNRPDSLITYVKDKKLNDQIAASNQWKLIYGNERYEVWLGIH